jgi:DNA-binding transcriptional MerR regulator
MSRDETFTIGELAARTGMTPDALRYYERLGVITPVRRTAGRFRIYTAETVVRLHFIKQAQLHGLTLAEIRELLQVDIRGGIGRCRRVQRLLQGKLEELDTRVTQLQEFRRSLEGFLSQCNRTLSESPEAECPVVEDLRRVK